MGFTIGEFVTPEEDFERILEIEGHPNSADEEFVSLSNALLGVAPLMGWMPKMTCRKLPAFSFGQHSMNVATGFRRQSELRDEEEKKKAEWRDMWTTPGQVPLAMAPPNEEDYWKKEIKSDLRFEKLFPKDVEKRSSAKDIEGEFAALYHYVKWLRDQLNENDDPRKKFYHELLLETNHDFGQLIVEREALLVQATSLQRFEWARFGNDGEIDETAFQHGIVVNDEHDEEVQAAYAWLFRKYPLPWRFSISHPYVFGRKEEVRKIISRDELARALRHYGKETEAKYGYLLRIFDEPSGESSNSETEIIEDEVLADSHEQSTSEVDEETRDCTSDL